MLICGWCSARSEFMSLGVISCFLLFDYLRVDNLFLFEGDWMKFLIVFWDVFRGSTAGAWVGMATAYDFWTWLLDWSLVLCWNSLGGGLLQEVLLSELMNFDSMSSLSGSTYSGPWWYATWRRSMSMISWLNVLWTSRTLFLSDFILRVLAYPPSV